MKAFLLSLLLGAPLAHSRLGETAAEIEQRYGKAIHLEKVDERFSMGRFKSMDFNVTVSFLDGKSQSEIFEKENRSTFSDDEINAVLAANTFGFQWTKLGDNAFDRSWKLGDAAIAHYSLGVPSRLSLFTAQMMTYMQHHQTERLKGL